jgi:hypothetical protein
MTSISLPTKSRRLTYAVRIDNRSSAPAEPRKSVTYVFGHLLPMSPVRTLGEGWGEGLSANCNHDVAAGFSPQSV